MTVKLFIGQIPKSFDEESIKEMFAAYADSIEAVNVIRNKMTNEPQGCAFISLSSQEEAEKAISELHNSKKYPGVTNSLQVKYADSEQERTMVPPKMGFNPYNFNYNPALPNLNFNAHSPSLLGAPPILGDGIYDLYSQQFDPMGMSMGMGMGLGMGMPAMGMGGKYNNNNGRNNPGVMPYPPVMGGRVGGPGGMGGPGMGGGPMNGGGSGSGPRRPAQSVGPNGSNLFVYNIPNTYTDNDLYGLFIQYGVVVSAKVYIDRNSGLSKGFGFVSYDNAISAGAAISSLNGMAINGKPLKVTLKQGSSGSAPY
eukprot:gene13851-16334_t